MDRNSVGTRMMSYAVVAAAGAALGFLTSHALSPERPGVGVSNERRDDSLVLHGEIVGELESVSSGINMLLSRIPGGSLQTTPTRHIVDDVGCRCSEAIARLEGAISEISEIRDLTLGSPLDQAKRAHPGANIEEWSETRQQLRGGGSAVDQVKGMTRVAVIQKFGSPAKVTALDSNTGTADEMWEWDFDGTSIPVMTFRAGRAIWVGFSR